jgi:hypothetical protein
MKTLTSFAVALLLAVAAPALAGEEAAATMADIVSGMNHFPNDEQKSTLSDIAADEEVDQNLRTIAEVIAGIQHQPSDADRQKLESIVADESASTEAKTLAGAVLRFEHKASAQDFAALETLTETAETTEKTGAMEKTQPE